VNLSREILCKLLDYDPVTGFLTWKVRGSEWFKGARAASVCKGWNKRLAGRPALACPDRYGYMHGHIFNEKAYAHQVIFVIVHGYKADEIDHEHGDITDNRDGEMRPVTHRENMINRAISANNSSGRNGVSFQKNIGRWRAYITIHDRQRHLGYFDKVEDAIAARNMADIEHGFHKNHGRKRA
jgi:hypothetical protein